MGIFQSPMYFLYISISLLFFIVVALVFMVPHGKLGDFSDGWISQSTWIKKKTTQNPKEIPRTKKVLTHTTATTEGEQELAAVNGRGQNQHLFLNLTNWWEIMTLHRTEMKCLFQHLNNVIFMHCLY